MVSINQLKRIANILRRDVSMMTTEAGSGHPTSCLSSAEIISTIKEPTSVSTFCLL